MPIKYTKECPGCHGQTEITTWKPPEGYDQDMRRFYCIDCNRFSWHIMTEADFINHGEVVKQNQAERKALKDAPKGSKGRKLLDKKEM